MDRPDAEHARWLLLKRAIDGGVQHDRLHDVLDQIDQEPDRAVADGARGYLIKSGGLDDEALASLAQHPGFADGSVRHLLEEEQELRRAGAASNTDELMRSARSGLKSVQLRLLERKELPEAVREYLADTGATRAIRNRAAHRRV